MATSTEFGASFTDDQRLRILRGVIGNYYHFVPDEATVFDTNRGWTSLMPLVSTILPEANIICCVRQVSWIIDSVERLISKNSLNTNRIFGNKVGGTVYSRVDKLMNSETGLIGLPWASLREAWFGEFASKLLIIDYDALSKKPKETMSRVYSYLKEPEFNHDYNDLRYEADTYDADLGIVGLHRVRPKVEFIERKTSIPPDLFKKYSEANFWLNQNLNVRSVEVITG